MKRILFLFLLMMGAVYVNAQDPPGYTQNKGLRSVQPALMIDSSISIPYGCGTPGSYTIVGTRSTKRGFQLYGDTCNGRLYVMADSIWYRLAKHSELVGGGGGGISQLGASPYGLIIIDDSTYRVDTAWGAVETKLNSRRIADSLKALIVLKLNISDTTGKWVSAIYRKVGSDSVFYKKNGVATFAFIDSTGGSGNNWFNANLINAGNRDHYGNHLYFKYTGISNGLFRTDTAALPDADNGFSDIDIKHTGVTIRSKNTNDDDEVSMGTVNDAAGANRGVHMTTEGAGIVVGQTQIRISPIDSTIPVKIENLANRRRNRANIISVGWDTVMQKIVLVYDSIGTGSSTTTVAHNTYTPYQNPVIIDTASPAFGYSGFPTVVYTPNTYDTAYIGWKSNFNHADDGPIWVVKTWDGGNSYTDRVQIEDTAGTVSIGRGATGRLVFAFTKWRGYTGTWFKYSDNGGITFTQVDTLIKPSYMTGAAPYGNGVTLPSGKIIFPMYGWNADSAYSYLIQSVDNGLTWTNAAVIKRSLIVGAFPEGPISETSVEKVNLDAATDGAQILMAVIRSDFYLARHYQAYSTDGGATWTNIIDAWMEPGDIATDFGATAGNWPAQLCNINGTMYMIQGVRGSSKNVTVVFRGKAMEVYNNAGTRWKKENGTAYSIIELAVITYKGATVDFGYHNIYPAPNGKPIAVGYDNSPSTISGVGGWTTPHRIRLYSIPVNGTYFYQKATSNQSISTATNTIVSFTWDNRVLDAYPAYNKDSLRYEFPEDGFYSVDARVTFDTSSAGTYRYAKVELIDRGHELGTIGSPTGGNQLIQEANIQPSVNARFCTINLHGKVYGKKGQLIRVTVAHDVGSSINILNTDATKAAELSIMKIPN